MVNNSPSPRLDSSDLSCLAQQALERLANEDIFDESCVVPQVLECIGNKWTVLIIYVLMQGTKRYNELQRQISGVSPKMLIQKLRSLEKHGFVKRLVYPVVPPKVEYSLTPLGQSLIEPLAVLCKWAELHTQEIDAASILYNNGVESETASLSQE
jgi:DNA-binding HxlR family transcriptional regulator